MSPTRACDDESSSYLRVHSKDLHEYIAQDVGDCFESGLYTDIILRCKDGQSLHAHRLVLAAVSPLFKTLLVDETDISQEVASIELPGVTSEQVQLLLEIVYNGVVEAELDELRSLVLLAHSLYIDIPISEDVKNQWNIVLPELIPIEDERSSSKKPYRKISHAERRANNNEKRLKMDLSLLSTFGAPCRVPGSDGGVEFLCPICDERHADLISFKEHVKFHNSDATREEKIVFINSLISSCYDNCMNHYLCKICNSTYTHPGNYKQHLYKHERETGALSTAMAYSNMSSISPQSSVVRSTSCTKIPEPPPKTTPVRKRGSMADIGSTGNSHLDDVLKSSFVDRFDTGFGPIDHTNAVRYTCEVCSRQFRHSGNYRQHLSGHLRALKGLMGVAPETCNVECVECEAVFDCEEAMETHVFMEHSSSTEAAMLLAFRQAESIFQCDQCDLHFKSEDWLDIHMKKVHSSNKDINKMASDETIFDQLSSPSKDFLASSFKIKNHLSNNISFNAKNNFICPVCLKSFHIASKLHAHMKIHSHPEEHYKHPCDICGKKFTRPQHVTRHKLLHTGEKPFKCNSCNKTFSREDKLKHHKNSRDCYTTQMSI